MHTSTNLETDQQQEKERDIPGNRQTKTDRHKPISFNEHNFLSVFLKDYIYTVITLQKQNAIAIIILLITVFPTQNMPYFPKLQTNDA